MTRIDHIPVTGSDFQKVSGAGTDYMRFMQKDQEKADSLNFTEEQIRQLRAVLKKMKEEELRN